MFLPSLHVLLFQCHEGFFCFGTAMEFYSDFDSLKKKSLAQWIPIMGFNPNMPAFKYENGDTKAVDI